MILHNIVKHGILLSIALLDFTNSGLAECSMLEFNCLRTGSDCVPPSHCDISTGRCQCLHHGKTQKWTSADLTNTTNDLTNSTHDLTNSTHNLTNSKQHLTNTTQLTDTAFDYQCNMYTINRHAVTCGNMSTCGDHGNCLDDSQTCMCDEGYYGEACNVPRVLVACSRSSMFININPHGQFQGSIYVLGRKKETECNLRNTISRNVSSFVMDNNTYLEGWNLSINHFDASCGNASSEKDPVMTDASIYRREFLIQYLADVETSYDQLITAKCRVSDDGASVSFGEISVKGVNKRFENVDVSDDSTANVTINVGHHVGTTSINTTFNLGDEMDLIFTMQKSSHSVFKDFKINKCTANNIDDHLQTVTMIDNECSDTNIRALFLSDTNQAPLISNYSDTNRNPVIVLRLKAFMFSGHDSTSRVTFLCNVHFCEDKCPHRQTCDGSTERMRRSIDNERDVSAVITVIDPVARIRDVTEMTHQCISDPTFIGVAATSSAVILILITACIVLVTKLRRLRPKSVAEKNDEYTNKTTDLRIPRLSLTT